MTVDMVREALAKIRDQADGRSDDEVAHMLEKELWKDVLTFIATNTSIDATMDDYQELATLALTSRDILFYRWFA